MPSPAALGGRINGLVSLRDTRGLEVRAGTVASVPISIDTPGSPLYVVLLTMQGCETLPSVV